MMETLETHASLFEPEPDAHAVIDVPRAQKKPTSRQAMLGQFLTPSSIANFMAQQFTPTFPTLTKLLDAGAGRGALSKAFIQRWRATNPGGQLEATAYENDNVILPELTAELLQFEQQGVAAYIIDGDFIELASTMVALNRGPRFTHAILNPPYKKISSASLHRAQLRTAGLETVNLYSGFVALALALLEAGGQLVAIIPRSFCNGPYYQPFRRFILRYASIERIHLFESRTKAFKDDGVLQENVIIKLIKGKAQDSVCISTSTDDSFSDLHETRYTFERIVLPDDENQFIHIPTGEDDDDLLQNAAFGFTIADLGLKVSTGPVVDFRMREHLVDQPEEGTVPLLYPGHFADHNVEWPREAFKKPNCIRDDASTRKWLYPNGYYTVVRRFSSKEEKRRLVASIIDPTRLPAEWIGIENHLNVIHEGRKPLSEDMARGLSVYLNSSVIEQYFRRFNGHTQVNATDLKNLPYPNPKALIELGRWAKTRTVLDQTSIDQKVNALA
jgi:adenine-specific DNA-methyltransferase